MCYNRFYSLCAGIIYSKIMRVYIEPSIIKTLYGDDVILTATTVSELKDYSKFVNEKQECLIRLLMPKNRAVYVLDRDIRCYYTVNVRATLFRYVLDPFLENRPP